MTAAAIRDEFARALGLDSEGASAALLAVCKALAMPFLPAKSMKYVASCRQR